MPIPLVFQEKFTEKYFQKFHLPKIQFQLLHGRFMNLLPYSKYSNNILGSPTLPAQAWNSALPHKIKSSFQKNKKFKIIQKARRKYSLLTV